MAGQQNIVEGQGHDGFPITPSDTTDIVADAGNTQGYKHCFVHNPSAGGTVKVITTNGTTITVYIAQGDIFPVAVTRVFNTSPTPPAGLVGIVNKHN